MASHRNPALALLTFCVASCTWAGCTPAYTPRASRRVSIVTQGGSLGYMREGVFFRSGLFGGQLEEAVAGNPEAMQHARTFRHLSEAGFGMSMGGLAIVLLGDAIVAAVITSSHGSGGTSLAPLIVVSSVGLSVDIAGLIFSLAAQHHHYDAINVFNDGVEFGPSPPDPRAPAAGQVRMGPVVPAQSSPPPW